MTVDTLDQHRLSVYLELAAFDAYIPETDLYRCAFSLALALGLAEMSSISQNAKLGNVLLDEGFGTLDDQALESALELLMELKNTGGKLVGIISHVEKLKEKISAKIEVQNHSGIGTLSGAGVVTGERLYQLSGQTPGSLPGASPRRKRRKNSPSAEE